MVFNLFGSPFACKTSFIDNIVCMHVKVLIDYWLKIYLTIIDWYIEAIVSVIVLQAKMKSKKLSTPWMDFDKKIITVVHMFI